MSRSNFAAAARASRVWDQETGQSHQGYHTIFPLLKGVPEAQSNFAVSVAYYSEKFGIQAAAGRAVTLTS